jgi:hypothetical protein
MKNFLRSFALTALAAVTPALGTPGPDAVELGADGTIYRLWSGTFGELFGPQNTAVPAAMPVLALDIVPPGQPLARHLVPGTEDPATEGSAALLFDRVSSSVHIVWNSRTVANQTVSSLHLRSLAPEGWTERIALSGGSLADKKALRLAQTTDSYSTRVDGEEQRLSRRVLHLVWAETAGELSRAFYSPVVFADGRYLGWNPIVELDEFAGSDSGLSSPSLVNEALREAPTLAATPSGTVSISFVHSQSKRLMTVELQALPGELGELAELARGHIVEIAAALGSEGRPELGTMARGHIVEIAHHFHPAAAAHIGDRIAAMLGAAEASIDGVTLAEMARGHIVEIAREILGSGLANACAAEELLLEIPVLDPGAAGADTAFSHFFALRRVAQWEIPNDPYTADAKIFVSAEGKRATIAWSDDSHLYYREAEADEAWSSLRILAFAQIPSADAWAAVARRASGL